MLRQFVGTALRSTAAMLQQSSTSQRAFSSILSMAVGGANRNALAMPKIVMNPALTPCLVSNTNSRVLLEAQCPPSQSVVARTVTKFSLNKGKRKSVKAVLKRFKRLDWGMWIRTHSGRNKKLFKKSAARKRRLRQHVFTNASQSWKLDKMVTNFWRRPKYYVDDPYEPYHRRDEYFATKGKSFRV